MQRLSACLLSLLCVTSLFDADGMAQAAGQSVGAKVADPLAPVRAALAQGDAEGALAAARQVVAAQPGHGGAWALIGYAHHALGEYGEALEAYEQVPPGSPASLVAQFNKSCLYSLRGELDAALRGLSGALEQGWSNIVALHCDPDFNHLRSDPRYFELLASQTGGPLVGGGRVLRAWRGEAAGDQFGWIGRRVPDVDADGVDDVLVSAPYKALNGASAGRIYVYSTRSGDLVFQRDGLPGDTLGVGIEGIGDVDGDGAGDVLVGGSGAAGGKGAAWILSGRDGELLHELQGEAVGDAFGRKVSGAGDVNGDGHTDVIIGAPQHDGAAGPDSGAAYVYSGKDGARLLKLEGGVAGDKFGNAVGAHTDAHGTFLICGAPNDLGGRGAVHAYHYVDGVATRVFSVASGPGDVNLGRMFVSFVGDVDGDGRADVYASDWESNAAGGQGSGRIYVHSGATGERLWSRDGEVAGDGFGIGTAEAGDVNGDGKDDLIVGAWQNDEGAFGAGKCYLLDGPSGDVMATYTWNVQGDTFGFDATGLGDVDGDGGLDFLITAAYSGVAGPQSGRTLVIAGPKPDELGGT